MNTLEAIASYQYLGQNTGSDRAKGLKVDQALFESGWHERIVEAALRLIGVLHTGESASAYDRAECLFHLRSLIQEWGHTRESVSESHWAYRLAERIAPVFGMPFAGVLQPVWYGQDPASMPQARAVIRAFQPTYERLTGEQIQELFDFYYGVQWPAEIHEKREGRPSLVINRLPALVAASIEMERCCEAPPLSREETGVLILAVTLQNRDAQRAYNYMVSAMTERHAVMASPMDFHRDAFVFSVPAL